ncbi:hypothetical protein DVH24_006987 [Malus domestica]|uniref:Uncharacterized protein n=1 Tax=Malus domestica TaxID=3750 RepID=A0A498KQL5_MALDO|nr:hypothetical protein DVH24_006987 [Malus domestica]
MAGGVSSTDQENKAFEIAVKRGEWEKLSLLHAIDGFEVIKSDQEPLPDYKDDLFPMTKKD